MSQLDNQKFIVEVRKDGGYLCNDHGPNPLDFEKEKVKRLEHPYLFSKPHFNIDQLVHYMCFGQGRDKPSGPMQLPAFMEEIGICYRVKYW